MADCRANIARNYCRSRPMPAPVLDAGLMEGIAVTARPSSASLAVPALAAGTPARRSQR